MKKTKVIIAIVLLLAVTSVFFVGCQSAILDNIAHDSIMESVSIEVGTVVYLSGGSGALASATLSAVVTPSNATNKAVEWSIEWEAPSSTFASGKNVVDYVNVIPDAFGSLNATVYCYQFFEGNAIVTVTTIDGGFTASAVVSYDGAPTKLDLITGLEILGTSTVPFHDVFVGETYYFDIELSNDMGVVGSQYNDFGIYGNLLQTNYVYDGRDYNKNTNTYGQSYQVSVPWSDIISVSIVNNQVVLSVHKYIGSGLFTHEDSNYKYGVYLGGYSYHPSDFFITVQELNSGVTGTSYKYAAIPERTGVRFRIKPSQQAVSVTGVTVNKATILF